MCQDLGNAFDDREAEAKTRLPAPVASEPLEFMKNQLLFFLRNAGSAVADLDSQPVSASPASSE